MKFLHLPIQAKYGHIVRVHFTTPTKIKLIHTSEFPKYKNGRTYRYRGGYYEESPAEFEIPFDGTWHAVVEKGGYYHPIELEAHVELMPPHWDTLNGKLQMETHEPMEEYDDTFE